MGEDTELLQAPGEGGATVCGPPPGTPTSQLRSQQAHIRLTVSPRLLSSASVPWMLGREGTNTPLAP